MMRQEKYYKLAQPDGWDFYTGETINYREHIGEIVSIKDTKAYSICSNSVIHASRNPNDCFVGAEIPCSAYEVWGVPVIVTHNKCGFVSLDIKKEITDLNALLGWDYQQAINPISPLKISPPAISAEHIELLKNWANVRDAVRDAVRDSMRVYVCDNVRDSLRNNVWDSVRENVWDSLRNNMWGNMRNNVWDSVRDGMWAYIGHLFPNIKNWAHTEHKTGYYPFQPVVDLWKMGLVSSSDGKLWRLHGGAKAEILWEGNLK